MCFPHRLLVPELPTDSLREIALRAVNLPLQSTEASEQNVFCLHFKCIPRRPGSPVLFLGSEAYGGGGGVDRNPEAWAVQAQAGSERENLSLPVFTPP